MNYSKGEWKFVPNEFNYPDGNETNMPGSIRTEQWFICRIDNAPEWEANAPLIAASPRMATLLEKIVSQDGWMREEDVKEAREILQTLA